MRRSRHIETDGGIIDVIAEVDGAEARIRPHVRETRLEPSAAFGPGVFFKCENLQHTGSFKVRGAFSKLLSLSEADRARGIVTASTGNHGAAVAYALGKTGASGTVIVPNDAAPTKLAAIERLGAAVEKHGDDGAESEAIARRIAAEHGRCYVSPYNDPQIIGGQGTIAVELLRQLDGMDAVFVSVGGGGLIAGIAGYLKARSPETRIIGCSPTNSQVLLQSVKAGEILDLPSLPTLSDGTAGGVEPGSITLPIARACVDQWLTVSEAEIAAALCRFIDAHHMLIEGSAAVALAGYLQQQQAWTGQRVVIVLCGANIGLPTLRQVLASQGH